METIADKYPLAIRILHWLMALLIITLLCMGLYMTDIPRTDPLHGQLYDLHKSLGFTVLVLAAIRLTCRIKLGAPPLPSIIKPFEVLMANLGHLGLYFFMFAMPLSGIIMTNSYGFAVHWFGIVLPKIIGVDKDRAHLAGEAHEYMAYALILLISLHVAGALKHYMFEKLNLFKRMM
jgi:cytochrome b561